MKRLTDNYERYISRFPEDYRGKRKSYPMNSGVIYEKLGAYEDLEDRLFSIYGECDGLLEKLVQNLGSLIDCFGREEFYKQFLEKEEEQV